VKSRNKASHPLYSLTFIAKATITILPQQHIRKGRGVEKGQRGRKRLTDTHTLREREIFPAEMLVEIVYWVNEWLGIVWNFI